MIRYVIVGMQRSGTTVLHEALASHPAVSCVLAEVDPIALFARGPNAYAWGNDVATNTGHRLSQRDAFDALTKADGTAEQTHFGVKMALARRSHAESLGVLQTAEWAGTKIVRLRRHDTLAQVASLTRAKMLTVWGVPRDRADGNLATSPPQQVAISRGAYLAALTEKMRVEALLDDILRGLDTLELIYEHDVEPRPQSAMAATLDHLGLGPLELSIPHAKQGRNLPDTVSNFESISAFAARLEDERRRGADADTLEARYAGILSRHRWRLRIGRIGHRLAEECGRRWGAFSPETPSA